MSNYTRDWSDFLQSLSNLDSVNTSRGKVVSFDMIPALPSRLAKKKDSEAIKLTDFLSPQEIEKTKESFPIITLNFLIKECQGWRGQTLYIEGKEFSSKNLKITNPVLWRDPFVFTDMSANTALGVYVSTSSSNNYSVENTKYSQITKNGDSIFNLLSWIYSKKADVIKVNPPHRDADYFTINQSYRYGNSNSSSIFEANPLVYLIEGILPSKNEAGYAKNFFKSKLFASLIPLWPWLSRLVLGSWAEIISGSRWGSVVAFRGYNKNLGIWMNAWIDHCVEARRVDLLIPLIEFYQSPEVSEDKTFTDINRLVNLMSDYKFKERGEARAEWVSWAENYERLSSLYEEFRSIHPVDRSAPEKSFMEAVEEHPHFTKLQDIYVKFLNELRNVIA